MLMLRTLKESMLAIQFQRSLPYWSSLYYAFLFLFFLSFLMQKDIIYKEMKCARKGENREWRGS